MKLLITTILLLSKSFIHSEIKIIKMQFEFEYFYLSFYFSLYPIKYADKEYLTLPFKLLIFYQSENRVKIIDSAFSVPQSRKIK